jgi:quinol monooxygenase YgiN
VLSFEVAQRILPANQFAIIEAWKDQAAFDAHQAAAHTMQANTALGPLLIAPIDTRVGTHMVSHGFQAAPAGAIVGVSHVDVAPLKRDDGFAMLVKFTEASRKAAGNVRSYPMREKTRLNHFTVIEVWKDQASIDASETSEAAKDFRKDLQTMTGALYDRRWYKAL